MIGQTGRGDRRGDHDGDRRLVVDAGYCWASSMPGSNPPNAIVASACGTGAVWITASTASLPVRHQGRESGCRVRERCRRRQRATCTARSCPRSPATVETHPRRRTLRPLDHRPTLDSRCDRRRKTVAAGREELGAVIEPGLACGVSIRRDAIRPPTPRPLSTTRRSSRNPCSSRQRAAESPAMPAPITRTRMGAVSRTRSGNASAPSSRSGRLRGGAVESGGGTPAYPARGPRSPRTTSGPRGWRWDRCAAPDPG